jgi:hypothetical protein
MRHTNYLLKPVTIDNAKPRDKAYALTDGGAFCSKSFPPEPRPGASSTT